MLGKVLIIALLLPLLSAQDAPPRHHLIGVGLSDPAAMSLVRTLGIPVESIRAGDLAELVVSDFDLLAFQQLRVAYVLLQEDLERYYEERLRNDERSGVSPPFGQGGMGGYHTFAETVAILDDLHAQFPQIVSAKWSIGKSIENRDLWVAKISDFVDVDEAEPEVRFDALHHSREPVSMEMTLFFMDWLTENYGSDPLATYLVNEREMYFIPVVNPDGYEYNRQTNPNGGGLWRKNRRNNGGGSIGVDLNRNYGFKWGYDDSGSSSDRDSETYRGTGPFSEPETTVMRDFFLSRNFQIAMSAHTYSNLLMDPWGYICQDHSDQFAYDLMGQYMTLDNHYIYGPICQTLYPANGNTVDYDWGQLGTWSKTVEIGDGNDGFWPPISRLMPLMEENLSEYRRLALYAAAGIEHDPFEFVESIGDADGNYEAGETFGLTTELTNAGTQSSATPVTLTLLSDSSAVQILDGFHDFGNLAEFASANNNSSPLSFQVASGASRGDRANLTLTLDYNGFQENTVTSVVVGEPQTIGADDLEINLGWLLGQPGDDASLGRWDIADPEATSSSGETVQPGDDHSTSGTRCAVTDGHAGSGAGSFDVDDGTTTLVSPEFDLEDAIEPRIRYWRWYSDLGSAPSDDDFLVDISNDGGQTWSAVEVLGVNANQWTQVAFEPKRLLTLTDRMRLRFRASDEPNNSLVEGLVDDVSIESFHRKAHLCRYGTPTIGKRIRLNLSGEAGETFLLFVAAAGGFFNIDPYGVWELDFASMRLILSGVLPSNGRLELLPTIPNRPDLIGLTPHLQAILGGGSEGDYFSNAIDFTIE